MWKNLKSYFIVEEDEPKATAKTKAKSPKVTSAKAPVPTPPSSPEKVTSTTGPIQAKVTDKFMKVLLTAMDEADQPGFDYLEFKKALQGLRKMSMDEATRFGSAYAMAETMGITPAKLITSAKHYLAILGKEEAQFKTALQGQRQAKVGDKIAKQKDFSQLILQKEAKIKELQTEIKKLDQDRKKLQKTIQSDTVKLDQTEADFGKTLQTLAEQIKGDITKMGEYLK